MMMTKINNRKSKNNLKNHRTNLKIKIKSQTLL